MMADVARRKETGGKRQYGAYSADEHTLSQSPGISLSVVRRPLHHCVIIAHIPYISLKKKSPLTSLILCLSDSGWCLHKRWWLNCSGKKHSHFIWQPWCIVHALICQPAANLWTMNTFISSHTLNWHFSIHSDVPECIVWQQNRWT